MIADRSWCLTEDGKRVAEGHPLARFLLVGKGCQIDDALFNAYPAVEESPVEDETPPKVIEITIDEDEPEPEAHPPPEGETAPKKRGRPPKPKTPPLIQE